MDPSMFISFAPNQNPNPNLADLTATISRLKSLLADADSALSSLSSSVLPAAGDGDEGSSLREAFLRCPFNPHHRMPPASLFRHSLHCASSPSPIPAEAVSSLLSALRYPSTLGIAAEAPRFPPADPDAELCFALDRNLCSGCEDHFPYDDCPGVVVVPKSDAAGNAEAFSIPGFLALECGNFLPLAEDVGDGQCKLHHISILPSEYWALRREAESWSNFPAMYLYPVLRAAANLGRANEEVIRRWIIANSPQFGILIDSAMRDHVCLLLKLCLKAVATEATRSLALSWAKQGAAESRAVSFLCPRLVGSMSWLALQLEILYGESNGQQFATGMLKESIIQAGSTLVFSKLKERIGTSNTSSDGSDEGGTQKRCEIADTEDVRGGCVYVSQVAAAIAALHERAFLENRIRELRFAQPISKPQIIMEYSRTIAMASEERAKRPNYKPILECDGFLSQHAQKQDSDKAKTKAELIAEERDYKRRRMSYRGKKANRNPAEVLRDIINDHMEEIKEAGGIGCLWKSDTGIYDVSHGTNIQGSDSDMCESHIISCDLARNSESHHADEYRKVATRTFHREAEIERYEHLRNHRRTREDSNEIDASKSETSHQSYSHHHRHERMERNSNYFQRPSNRYEDSHTGSNNWKDSTRRSTHVLEFSTRHKDYIPRDKSSHRSRTDERFRPAAVHGSFSDRYNPDISHEHDDYSYAK